jgi:hypothetical protein
MALSRAESASRSTTFSPLRESSLLAQTQEPPVGLAVAVFSHGTPSELAPPLRLCDGQDAARFQDPLAKELRRFIQEHDIDVSSGHKVCQGCRHAGLKFPARFAIFAYREQGDIKIALWTWSPPSPRAKKD